MRRLLNRLQNSLPTSTHGLGYRLYNRLPLDLRYGKIFRATSALLAQSQFWSIKEHEAYQTQQLRQLVAHAYANIPFYRSLYDSFGVSPNDITNVHDIQKLPIISKDDIRAHVNEMKAQNFLQSQFQYHTTGGSTGKPVGFYWEADRTVPMEYAFMRRQWRWAGFEMGKQRSIVLRGIPLPKGKTYQMIPGNQMRLSTYDLTQSAITKYIEIIRSYEPVALQSYPSAAYILAQHILKQGWKDKIFPSLKIVLCGSENLYPWQRKLIGEAFKSRVYSWYGQSEYVALGGECEHSTNYHFYSEYGITEFLDPLRNPVEPGEIGEIVATGFNNYAMPLIRYRTEDRARLSTSQKCECGRNYPLVSSIEGRLQEMIVGKDGNLISMTAINMHDSIFDNVYQFQFYQDTPGKIQMRIHRKVGYTRYDEEKIRSGLFGKLRNRIDVNFEYVDSIPTTSRGKATFLIQKLDLDFNIQH